MRFIARKPGQTGKLLIGDTELEFWGYINVNAGCCAKPTKSWTAKVRPPRGVLQPETRLTATAL